MLSEKSTQLPQLVALMHSRAADELMAHLGRYIAEFSRSGPERADYLLSQMLRADALWCHDSGGDWAAAEHARSFNAAPLWARRVLALSYGVPRGPVQPPPERVRAAERVFLRELRGVRGAAAQARREAAQAARGAA